MVCPTPQHSSSALWHWVQSPTGLCFHLGTVWSWCELATQTWTSLEHQVRLSHPHLYLSPAAFQDFCDLKPKVGQQQAAPGQHLNWVSISRGKSCSFPNEVVSFPQELPQCTLPWVWIGTVHVAHGPQQEGGPSGAVLAVEPAVKPAANCLLGQLWDVGMAAGQCITCPEQGSVSCQAVRDHPSGGCCRRGLYPHCNFFPHLQRCCLASLDAVGVMFHTLQWHSTGRLPLNQANQARRISWELRKVRLLILACSCKGK